MNLFDSIVNLANETGFSPDTILWIFGFGLAVYWIVSVLVWSLGTALWIKVFTWVHRWRSDRRKK